MQYIGLTEDTADLYLTQIKHHPEDKYDPNLLVKVPFIHKNNSYDGILNIKILLLLSLIYLNSVN